MSLFYNLIYRKNPLRPEDQSRLYVSLHTLNMAKLDEVVKKITEYNNIPPDICRAVLNGWNRVAMDLLTNGRFVELGDAGYVYLTASSGGADTEEEATVDLVKRINGRISFSKIAKDRFNDAHLINVGSMTRGINQRDSHEQEGG